MAVRGRAVAAEGGRRGCGGRCAGGAACCGWGLGPAPLPPPADRGRSSGRRRGPKEEQEEEEAGRWGRRRSSGGRQVGRGEGRPRPPPPFCARAPRQGVGGSPWARCSARGVRVGNEEPLLHRESAQAAGRAAQGGGGVTGPGGVEGEVGRGACGQGLVGDSVSNNLSMVEQAREVK